MDKQEIYKEMQMTYDELQAYLIEKNGVALYDYFLTPECKTKNRKVSRTKEGLFCHHMDEDKGIRLSNTNCARSQPFEWQKKERLVYCNILEHLILHIKISVMYQECGLSQPRYVENFVMPGVYYICNDINDMYNNDGTNVQWKRRCYEEIKDNYDDYISILKALLFYIDDKYYGDKNEKRYINAVDRIIKEFSLGYGEILYNNVYEDIKAYENDIVLREYSSFIGVDFLGYDYPQFMNIRLTSDYDAENADEYISKALPMYCDEICNLDNKTPFFWKGPNIPDMGDKFYIIRVKTVFDIKKGQKAFVRYREKSDVFRRIDEQSNWLVLKTSAIYNKENKKCWWYEGAKGERICATVNLTLGKDDFMLFKERYDIFKMIVLDGCWFEEL